MASIDIANAAQAAVLREVTEQGTYFQQRAVQAAARAGAAEQRIKELSSELEALRDHARAVEAELQQLKFTPPPEGEAGKVVNLGDVREHANETPLSEASS
jgi:hypothetical protein